MANYRELVFGSVTADSLVDFQNALSISTNSNVIRVLDNTGSTGDKARISGNITGSGRLIKEGAGTLELTGTNTYTGTTTVNAGTLLLASNGAGSDYTQVQVGTLLAKTTFGATTTALAFDTTNGNGTYSNALTMAAGLTKLGANTLTLNGTNTYTGVTTVSAGTLLVNGSTSASSAVNVSSGATLGGSGTVGGSVTVNGTLSPGNSPGTLSTGAETWNPGGNYNWQVLSANGTAGTGYDTIAITGNLSLSGLSPSGKFNINLWSLSSIGPDVSGNATNFNNASNYTWTIASTTGGSILGFDRANFNINTGPTNGTGGFSNGLNGGSFDLLVSGNNLNLTFTAVPEPSTGVAMVGKRAV